MSFFDLAFDPNPDLSWLDHKISDDFVIFCSCYQSGDDRYTNWGLKDITNGEILIEPIYDSLSYDEVSEIIIGEYSEEGYYDDGGQFADDHYCFAGAHYYITFDKYGNRILDEEYDDMIVWGESRLLVNKNGKWGSIYLKEPRRVQHYWDHWISPLGQIEKGQLRLYNLLKREHEYYNVDLDRLFDAELWPTWRKEISVFEEGAFDVDGSRPRYHRTKRRYSDYFIVSEGERFGLVKLGYGLIIPIEYDAIEFHSETIWCTKQGKTIKFTRDTLPKTLNHNSPLKKNLKECYLFFDTETTGLPKDYRAPSSAINNWPRLIQLSWIIADKEGFIIKEHDHIIYPEGFMIPRGACLVNGISTEVARKKGEKIKDVLELFMEDVESAKFVVGHNVSFDMHVVGAELIRLKKKDTLANKPNICTMQSTIDFCAIPGAYGYKYPKLQELYKRLFGCEFEDAHNALADIRATLKCFFELKKKGILTL